MKNSFVLVVGAGLSAPFGMPVDYGFFDSAKYKANLIDDKEPYFLRKVLEKLYGPGGPGYQPGTSPWRPRSRLETVWSEIEINSRSPKITLDANEVTELNNQFFRNAMDEKGLPRTYYYHHYFRARNPLSPYSYLFKFADWELRKLLIKIFSNTSLWTETQLQIFRQYVERLAKSYKKIHIINFNYDLFVEYALEGLQFELFNMDSKKMETENIVVVKLHGSVGWTTDKGGDQITLGRRPVSCDDIGYDDNGLKEHCIIGLTYDKPKLSVEDEDAPDNLISNYHHPLFGYYIPKWLEQSFAVADGISIIGYSFPTADSYFRSIVTRAMQTRIKNRHPKFNKIAWYLKDDFRASGLDIYERQLLLGELFDVEQENIDFKTNGWEADLINSSLPVVTLPPKLNPLADRIS